MKQKVVLKLQMNDSKRRSKALKVVVSIPGVLSAAIEGEEKNKIVVVGDGVDSISLTTLLRKSLGFAELVSVTPMDDGKKKHQKDHYGSYGEKEKEKRQINWDQQASIPQTVYYVHENNHDPCSIM